MIQRTALKRASVHGCFSGRNSCGIYSWWILWISIAIQNEKELIRPRRILPAARATRARSAQFYVVLICHDSTGVGGLFCICVESINLTTTNKCQIFLPPKQPCTEARLSAVLWITNFPAFRDPKKFQLIGLETHGSIASNRWYR